MALPPQSPSRHRTLFVNTLANVLGRSWSKFLALLIIPWLFIYLGQEHWAVYGMGLTVMFLAALADPGLRFGYVKVFAELIEKKQGSDLRRLLGASFLCYALCGILGLGVARLAIEPIMDLAGVVPTSREPARMLFMAFFIHLVIRETFSVFYFLLLAQQRMTLANLLTVPGDLFHYGGLALVIHYDWGLRGVGIVFISSAAIQGLLYFASLPGALARVPKTASRQSLLNLFKYLFSFSWRIKVAVGCDTLVLHVDKIFITQFVGFEAAGLYQLGSSLAIVLRDFVRHLISAILPIATTLAIEGDRERLRRVNRLTSRWFFILASPCFLFTAAMAPAIVAVWVGKPIAQAALALGLLSVAFHAGTALSASMEVGAACHAPQLQMRSAALTALANLILSLALVLTLGFKGVLLASILSHFLGSLVYARLINRVLEDDLRRFLRDTFMKPLLAAILPALALFWYQTHGLFAQIVAFRESSIVQALGIIALLFAIFLLLYITLLVVFRHLTSSDYALLKSGFRKPGRF